MGYEVPVYGSYVGEIRTKHEGILQGLSTIPTDELQCRELDREIYEIDLLTGHDGLQVKISMKPVPSATRSSENHSTA